MRRLLPEQLQATYARLGQRPVSGASRPTKRTCCGIYAAAQAELPPEAIKALGRLGGVVAVAGGIGLDKEYAAGWVKGWDMPTHGLIVLSSPTEAEGFRDGEACRNALRPLAVV